MSRLSLGTMVEDVNASMVEQSHGGHSDGIEAPVMLATERDEVILGAAVDWDESITEGALLRTAGDRADTSNLKRCFRAGVSRDTHRRSQPFQGDAPGPW